MGLLHGFFEEECHGEVLGNRNRATNHTRSSSKVALRGFWL